MTERDDFSGGSAELERALLRSARLDEQAAPPAVRSEILAAVGAAAGVVGASGAAAGSAATALAGAHSFGAAVVVKWLAAGAVLSAATIGAVHVTRRPAVSAPSAAAKVATSPHVVSDVQPASPVAAPATAEQEPTPMPAPVERRRVPAAKPAPVDEPSPAVPTPLTAEVALLDRARADLAAGQPAKSLAVLDAYQRGFPNGNLRPEATYLRIQALLQAGNRAAARDLAVRFLAQHPDSPHAAQLSPLTAP
jgi:hypothetical protein